MIDLVGCTLLLGAWWLAYRAGYQCGRRDQARADCERLRELVDELARGDRADTHTEGG